MKTLLCGIFALFVGEIVGLPQLYFPDEIPKRSKRISERKCEEYTKLYSKTFSYSGLSLFPSESQTIEASSCDNSIGLILGGQVAKPGEFPHMAAIGWKTLEGNIDFACGGSLITDQFVLSVAHCGKKRQAVPTVVRLGDQNLQNSNDGADAREFKIKKLIKHPSYNPKLRINDIALIQLNEKVTFTRFIKPACLQEKTNFGRNVTATGWGVTSRYGATTDELMKVGLNIVDSRKCFEMVKYDLEINNILDSQICAGGEEDKDTCQGDSGGPIQVIQPNCVFKIVGLTSYGAVCGSTLPSIYTRVSYYLDWIESIVW